MLRVIATTILVTASAAASMAQDCSGGWSQLASVGGPPPVYGHAVAYDSARNRVVVFGGNTGCSIGGTWEHDGASWTQRQLPNSPSPRNDMAMAFDPIRQVCVMFGGTRACPDVFLAETWEYNGASWTLRSGSSSAVPSASGPMAFDPVRGKVILFAGISLEMWEWDGTSWSRFLTGSPWISSMAYDPIAGAVIGVGVAPINSPIVDTITYRLTPAGWSQIAEEPDLYPAGGHLVRDDAAGVLLRFATDYTRQTRVDQWNGAHWETRAGVAPPDGRGGAQFVYQASAGRTLMVGGHGAVGLRADTTWSFVFPPYQIVSQPRTARVVFGAAAAFEVAVNGPVVQFQWRKDGVPLSDNGRVVGTQTSRLTINYVSAADEAAYDCVTASTCGQRTSHPAALLAARVCDADINTSGSVTTQDLFDFLALYFAPCP